MGVAIRILDHENTELKAILFYLRNLNSYIPRKNKPMLFFVLQLFDTLCVDR
jgi:hypothetical protein